MRALTSWILVFVGAVAACRSTPSAAPVADAGPAGAATPGPVAATGDAGAVTAGVEEPKAVPLPPSWPKSVGFPPGSVVLSVEPTAAHGLEARASVPLSPGQTAAFYRRSLKGYAVEAGDFNADDQQGYSFGRGGKPMMSLMATGPGDAAMLVLVLEPALLTKQGP